MKGISSRQSSRVAWLPMEHRRRNPLLPLVFDGRFICNHGPEDVMHLLFLCPMAQELWTNLGLLDSIQDSVQVDHSGSYVLEHLITRQDNSTQGFNGAGMKEVISITSLYLWWIWRRGTRDEMVPPM
jgi:hypothetical protein